MRHLYFILFLGLVLTSFSQSDPVYVLQKSSEPVRISPSFLYYEDRAHSEDKEEILRSGDFRKIDQEVPNFNVTKATIWAKLKVTCTSPENWFLALDPSGHGKVSFFQKANKNEWKETIMGNMVPTEQRIIPINHFLFKLDIHPGDTAILLLKVRDYLPISFDLKVAPLEQFVGLYHNIDIYNGICYGIMIMMLIYNFYLFVTNKNVVYLYYVLYVFFSILFTAILSGYAFHLPDFIKLTVYNVPIIPPAGFGIFGLLFTLKFFKEVLSPRFKKITYVFIVFVSLNTILSATEYKHLSENIIQPSGLLLGILSISAAVIALRKKHTSANYYLIGFGAYMLSLFYLIFAAQGFFHISTITWCILVTGSTVEAIMLSFALGDKFKLAQKEKEKAQIDSLIQAKENERLVKEQNTILEQKVKERTMELQKQKEKIQLQKELIEEKQKEILDSIQYAKHIQTALLPPEKQIDKMLRKKM